MNSFPKFNLIKQIFCTSIVWILLIHGHGGSTIDEDVKTLHDTINNWSEFWEHSVKIFPNRTCAERAEIRERYKELFKEDLEKKLILDIDNGESMARTRKKMIATCLFCNESFLVYQLYLSIKMIDYSNSVLDLAAEMSLDPEVRKRIFAQCDEMLGPEEGSKEKSKEKSKEEPEGHCVKRILKTLCNDVENIYEELLVKQTRDTKMPVNKEKAKETAHAVIDERNKWDDERDILDSALMSNSISQLREILKSIEEIDKHNLTDIIDRKMQLDKSFTYKSLIRLFTNPNEYYAIRLHDAFDGPRRFQRPFDAARIIIQFSETYLKNIISEYEKIFPEVSFHQAFWESETNALSGFLLPFIDRQR